MSKIHGFFTWAVILVGVVAFQPSGAAKEILSDLPAYYETLCTDGAEELSDLPRIFCQMEPARVQLTNPQGEDVTIHVLVARTAGQRAAGFQDVPEDVMTRTAILFQFERPTSGAFHMCNVEAPLDILWVRQDGRVLDSTRMLPGPKRPAGVCQSLYAPTRPGTYTLALETPAGLLETVGYNVSYPLGWRLVVEDGD